MKEYNISSIYFGDIIYNTDDGYYYTSNWTFEKIEDNKFQSLKNKSTYDAFNSDSDMFIGAANLCPLSALVSDKEKKMMSKRMIKLYRLKYMVLRSKTDLLDDDIIVKSPNGKTKTIQK